MTRRILSALVVIALASIAGAQDVPPPSLEKAGIEAKLMGGAMQFMERGKPDSKDFVYRLSVKIPAPAKIVVFDRLDYTRTQDGGALTDPSSFRSIENQLGLRRDLGQGFSVTGFTGLTWNQDSAFQPVDPRLWTLAAGVRYDLPGRGSLQLAGGHHGPVGGAAVLVSASYDVSESASWFADFAIPLDASRFAARPYTGRVGVMVTLKRWK